MSITIAGRGLLGGMVLDEERAAGESAKQRAKDEEYAAYARDLEERYEKVQGWLALDCWEQLQAEAALPTITAEAKSDLAQFESFCARERYPAMPTDPTPVAEFIRIFADDAAHAERLRDAISLVHRSLKLTDPTNDPLVRAVIRFFHDAKQPSPPRQAKVRKQSASKKGTTSGNL